MDKEKEMTEAVMCAIKYRERIGTPNFELMAKNLIKAGYGNVKQAVKEFAEKLKAEIRDLLQTALSFSVRQQAPQLIDLVYKELYGKEE